jgi:NAD-reducing hydrogenase small subunit
MRLATLWLDGCSGCHMSLLDLDERLAALAERFELVYSPLVDARRFPEGVDAALVEGAVCSGEDEHTLRLVRERSRRVISFGDCAVTANVPGIRNRFDPQEVLARAYLENASHNAALPGGRLPALLPRSRPVHAVIRCDYFLPGCPPPADAIGELLAALLEDRLPGQALKTRFGA